MPPFLDSKHFRPGPGFASNYHDPVYIIVIQGVFMEERAHVIIMRPFCKTTNDVSWRYR